MSIKRMDITGQRFGRLTAIKPCDVVTGKPSKWLCKCDCGKEKIVKLSNIRDGHTSSCGCARLGVPKKGRVGKKPQIILDKRRTREIPEYVAWQGIKNRCYNTNSPSYHNYGGRGIQVCEQWRNSFVAFYSSMGPRPSKQHSIDRINNDGDYEPGNCRWATASEQNKNKRYPKHKTKNC